MDKPSKQQDEPIRDLPLAVAEAGEVKGGGIKVPQGDVKRQFEPN